MFSFLKKIFTKEYERKSPRVPIDDEHIITLKIKSPTQENFVEYEINNISTYGISFNHQGEKKQFQVNDNLEAKVLVNYKAFTCALNIRHISDKYVGCEMVDVTRSLLNAIIDYFRYEIEALKVNYISFDKLQPDPDGNPAWFYGGENFELFYVEDDGKIIKFRLKIFANSIEVDKNNRMILGHIWEDEPSEKLTYKRSSLINEVAEFPAEVFDNAIKFVSNLEKLPSDYKDQIVKRLNQQ